jgi:hypothetical protein
MREVRRMIEIALSPEQKKIIEGQIHQHHNNPSTNELCSGVVSPDRNMFVADIGDEKYDFQVFGKCDQCSYSTPVHVKDVSSVFDKAQFDEVIWKYKSANNLLEINH